MQSWKAIHLEEIWKDFFPKVNIIHERAQFNRSQDPGETTDSFITDLYKLVETCDYGAKRDEVLRDRIVVGLSDLKLSENLHFKSDLTLVKAVEYVWSVEQVKQQAQNIRPKENSVHGKLTEMDISLTSHINR